MTRDDIIRMAQEAGIDMGGHPMNPLRVYVSDLERFAALLRDRMVAEGWRQCAVGQRTTQWCAEAERMLAEGKV